MQYLQYDRLYHIVDNADSPRPDGGLDTRVQNGRHVYIYIYIYIYTSGGTLEWQYSGITLSPDRNTKAVFGTLWFVGGGVVVVVVVVVVEVVLVVVVVVVEEVVAGVL